jgi:hypothetical protein
VGGERVGEGIEEEDVHMGLTWSCHWVSGECHIKGVFRKGEGYMHLRMKNPAPQQNNTPIISSSLQTKSAKTYIIHAT